MPKIMTAVQAFHGIRTAAIILTFFLGSWSHGAESKSTTIRAKQSQKFVSPWEFSADLGWYRGLDELDKDYAHTSAHVGYKLNPKLSLNFDMAYSYLASKYESSEEANNSQFEDTTFGLNKESLFTIPSALITAEGSVLTILPTSKTSHKSGMRGGLGTRLNLARPFYSSRLMLTQTNALYYLNYEYETADTLGTHYNIPLIISNGLSLSYFFTRRFSTSVSAEWSQLMNYLNHWVTVQSFRGSLNYQISRPLAISLSAQSKDRVVTNSSLFDDDNSQVSAGFSFIF